MKKETRNFLLSQPIILGEDEEGNDIFMEDDEYLFEQLGSLLEKYYELKISSVKYPFNILPKNDQRGVIIDES